MTRLLGFPNPVNEIAARTVATGVAVLSLATVLLSIFAGAQWLWLTAVLAYGFVARVLTGPRLSPLGQLATRVVAPALGRDRPVPGPPKRFAQAIGATLTVAATFAHFAFAADVLATVLVAMVLAAATLESVFGYCLGCTIFAALMKVGVIPEETCEACADVSLRTAASTAR